MHNATVEDVLNSLTRAAYLGTTSRVLCFQDTHFEMSVEQHAKLTKALETRLALIQAGLEEADPITWFVCELLLTTGYGRLGPTK